MPHIISRTVGILSLVYCPAVLPYAMLKHGLYINYLKNG
jgi:hypothetical protein